MTPGTLRFFLAIAAIGPVFTIAQEPKSGHGASVEEIIAASDQVCAEIEYGRTLPEAIAVGWRELSVGQYFGASVEIITALNNQETIESPSIEWLSPDLPYQSFRPEAGVYSQPLSKNDYLAFFDSLSARFPIGARLPFALPYQDSEIRFIDAFYLSASVLRFFGAYGFLPTVADLKLASARGLFPWDIPSGMDKYTGTLYNSASRVGFNDYYKNNAMDYQMYDIASEMIGDETEVYEAGWRIFNEVSRLYYDTPYGYPGMVLHFGYPSNSIDMIHHMQGTSGTPHRPKEGLYPAAGIPYGNGGAAFFSETGWVNAEIHAPYGTDLSENPFYYYDAENPEALSDFLFAAPLMFDTPLLDTIDSTIRREGPTVRSAGMWVNPGDIEELGAHTVLASAAKGGFDYVVLTVKTYLGHLYFETNRPEPRQFVFDALRELVNAAEHSHIKVYAALGVLSDNFFLIRQDDQDLWAQSWIEDSELVVSNFLASPCNDMYQTHIRSLLNDLHGGYQLDGILLTHNWVAWDGWENPHCELTDGGERAKAEIVAFYANQLANHSKNVAPDVDVHYVLAPTFDEEGHEYPIGSLSIDDACIDCLNSNFDSLVMTIPGLSWITDEEWTDTRYAWPYALLRTEIERVLGQSRVPVQACIYVSGEWQYPGEYYRGFARELAGLGLSGVLFHSPNSAEGEMGPAFTPQQYGHLENFKLRTPPPFPVLPRHTDGRAP